MPIPDPRSIYPNLRGPRGDDPVEIQRVAFLKPLAQSQLTEVGEFTYYDDADGPALFERDNVLFHYGPDRLVIGRDCSLATGVLFVVGAANHLMTGVST